MDEIFLRLAKTFSKIFDTSNELRYFFAPGRVNLIGEHTDYNGGNVFPCALDIGTYAVVNQRRDITIRFYSENFPESGVIEISLGDLAFNELHQWANYPKGVIKTIVDAGYKIDRGFDVAYFGNIPNGAGLSSSASIEVLTASIIKNLNNLELSAIDIAKLGQKAENNYIGVNCGIMDQFAVAMGKPNMAILLDCNTLKYEYATLELTNYVLVIANTNKQRGLADSKYNERCLECKAALAELQTELDIKSLCQLDRHTFDLNAKLITNPINFKRARHAIYENQRTLDAVLALQGKDLIAFGQLMNQSHISLRDDYEVTGFELDSLVEAAWRHPACIGSRMTGAGFGGCTVSLVDKQQVENFIKNVGSEYKQKTCLQAEFYSAGIGDGACEIMRQA